MDAKTYKDAAIAKLTRIQQEHAMRIISLKEILAEQQEHWANAALDIESWLKTVDDSEIRSIVRWHYILGL